MERCNPLVTQKGGLLLTKTTNGPAALITVESILLVTPRSVSSTRNCPQAGWAQRAPFQHLHSCVSSFNSFICQFKRLVR